MPTVTIDADRWERVRHHADIAFKHCFTLADAGVFPEREKRLEPGDLDPVEIDEEASIEAMLDAVMGAAKELVEITLPSPVLGLGWGCWVDEVCFGHSCSDWRDVLRAAYRRVVGE